MRVLCERAAIHILLAMLVVPVTAGSLAAQELDPYRPNIVVNGERLPDPSQMSAGPEVKGIISARNGDRIKVTTATGTSAIIAIMDRTEVKARTGLFGSKPAGISTDSLVTGLPVTVETLQWSGGLAAREVSFKASDLKTALMIHHGTAQQFDQQTAATEALRGRMGDIDKYNIKNTTNVYFASGKAVLSPQAKTDLCNAAQEAGRTDNALMLVVGYTDSTGSAEVNQALSEKRAGNVINYLQQVCRWKPYRMLSPTGMAAADPLADNTTEAGRAQNRRVSVNVLVSKALDGM
jgi:outer membrane protein OmpA-like peptidoglycan-associated protein